MREIILIQVSGNDRPGLTAAFTGILARYRLNVLDIGQAVIHDTLSLGILVETPPDAESSSVLKDLLFEAHKLNINVRFRPIDEDRYEEWVAGQGKDRHIITLLARKITAEQLADVTTTVADNGLNIDSITRLSGRVHLEGEALNQDSRACIEISVRGEPHDGEAMRAAFLSIANERNLDIAFQRDSAYRRNRRLVVFDMDSTLIGQECIDELADFAGVKAHVSDITERAMRGELDFEAALTERVGLLKGLPLSNLQTCFDERIRLNDGAVTLAQTMKKHGALTVIVSGGFTFFTSRVAKATGFEHDQANTLIDDGKALTGGVGMPILGREAKKSALMAHSKAFGGPETAISIGDGANDLAMITASGLGIAYRAKPIVASAANCAIDHADLTTALYFQGFRDDEFA